MGIPDDVFWHASLGFLHQAVEAKAAYEGWHAAAVEAEREARRK